MQLWAVIMGMSFWKIFGNGVLVCLGRGTWKAYWPSPIQHAYRFFLLLFLKKTARHFRSLLLSRMGGHWWKHLCSVCALLTCMCAGSAATSQAARNCSHTAKVCLYSGCWVSNGKAKMKTAQSRLAFSFFPHFGSHGDPMFHASVASPPTSQSQAMLLGTGIFSSPTCVFCVPGGNFWAFHSGLLSCVLLELPFCSLFPFQKSYVFGQGWGLFYFSHRKETWALWTTSYAQESSSGLQYKTAITAQTWITHLSN